MIPGLESLKIALVRQLTAKNLATAARVGYLLSREPRAAVVFYRGRAGDPRGGGGGLDPVGRIGLANRCKIRCVCAKFNWNTPATTLTAGGWPLVAVAGAVD